MGGPTNGFVGPLRGLEGRLIEPEGGGGKGGQTCRICRWMDGRTKKLYLCSVGHHDDASSPSETLSIRNEEGVEEEKK